MKELYLAFGLLVLGFVSLEMRATRDPYDYRQELLVESSNKDSLANAMEKALKSQESEKKKLRHPATTPPKSE